jgi:CTD small phosphatase-like protein 2
MIIDNMPQNFRLQKENGIFIKTFYGEDQEDTALFELIPILTQIAEVGGDVRRTLVKFKDDILNKVSSNLGKQQSLDK